MSNLKRTPLYEKHIESRAKLVNFGGWEMPIQYKGALFEHNTVRKSVGLFDVSHMGEIEIIGPDALSFLQSLTTNDVSALKQGDVQYSAMCYEDGGIVDDLLIYKMDNDHFLLCVNASNTKKDYDWISKNHFGNIEVKDTSNSYAQFAVQGFYAEKLLQELTSYNITNIKYFKFKKVKFDNFELILSRTGYTGEDGFELYVNKDHAKGLWDKIMFEGKKYNIEPIGLAARDTLRLEMGYMLYGNDINENTNPYEAGLFWIVKPKKGNFIGRDAILENKEKGIKKRLIGFELTDKGIARSHHKIFKGNTQTGEVTSGTFSPSLKKSIGLGYVDSIHAGIDEAINIEVRGKFLKAKITKPPFYREKRVKI